MRRSIAVLLAAVALAGSACSSNTSPAPQGSSCPDLSSGSVFTLTLKDFRFHPDCLVVRSEQSIKIVNQDGTLHNFTITGTNVDVDIQAGQKFSGGSAGVAPGTYDFFCQFHAAQGMKGTITVQ